MKKKITWEKANYDNCWRGVYSERIHFTIIRSKDLEFILQIPGILTKGGSQNLSCGTFEEAQQIAEQYL
jgi:hypothetical protein